MVKLRKIGRVKTDSIKKLGKPGKKVLVKKIDPEQMELLPPPKPSKLGGGFKESPTDKVDPEFLEFFSGDFKRKSEWDKLLHSVKIPGMADASWDRKAAWLYWQAAR